MFHKFKTNYCKFAVGMTERYYRMRKLFILVAVCLTLSSCFKDEEANSECDIQSAIVHVSDYSTLFYSASDTMARINEDYASSNIVFNNVLLNADLTALAPEFTITEGATIEPASGTVRDFSNGGQTYTVTSEDGRWSRTYTVMFSKPQNYYQFDFENYFLDSTGRYYVWSDLSDDEEPNWGTANAGYGIARSSATPDEYPTVPDTDGYDGACVKLTTRSTGAWGAATNKRLAAGNLFLGSFDVSKALTETMKSTLFGLPFGDKPLRFSGYYKYQPGEQMQDADGNYIDGTDSAALYAVLYRNHDDDGNSVVLTGDDIGSSALRVGRADACVETSSEWVAFDVEFDYWDEVDEDLLASYGYNLAIVCSSSEDGNEYKGAIGSTLWVDKLSIIVEDDSDDEE